MSEKSFENLVSEHGRQVLNTALRVLGDVNLANDVHQEVFLAIWKRWPRYNGHTNWPAYLYRATVRKALQTARRQNGYQRAAPPQREDTNQRPESDLRADELRQKLAVALAGLPKRQADVFILRRLEGLETTEVARLLGCSHQTVSVHLHRALRKLSRSLSAYLG